MSNMPVSLMEDSPPYLNFEVGVQELREESIKSGRKIYKDVENVIITPMGDNKTQVIKECGEWLSHLKERRHHNMISEKYLDFCEKSYEAWKGKRAAPIIGTPIEQWPQVTPSEVKMILDANFRTIEDLAKANDEGLGLIGMGARMLKKKAAAYLASAKNHGAASEKLTSLESELETQQIAKEEMMKRIAELEAKLAASPVIKEDAA